ncbi:MAG: helix-turn-helix transcriptional regulator [Clostridia bacterium]|nr:helix-turn-helix transcriptional regulator [Clostridia bacterium]
MKTEALDLIHLPHGERFSLQEVKTEGDYSAKHIHMHDTHEINLVLSPSLCRIRSNGALLAVQGPAVILQRRGSYHAILSASGPFESRVIYFDPTAAGESGERLMKRTALFDADVVALPLTEGDAETVLSYYALIREQEGDARLYLVLSLLAFLASLGERERPAFSHSTKNTYIFPLIGAVQDRPWKKWTIETLGRTFHVSPTKLKGDFHAVTGQTVKAFVTHTRLQRAKILLEERDTPLSQIALACGFSGESHLIRAFRDAFGTTPGAWRRERENT